MCCGAVVGSPLHALIDSEKSSDKFLLLELFENKWEVPGSSSFKRTQNLKEVLLNSLSANSKSAHSFNN